VELRKRALISSRWTLRGAEFPILTKLCETGAIKNIKQLVCEFHVWQDKMDEFVKILDLLRSNKMQFSMNAAAGPHLGLAAEESPFEVIKRKQIFLDLFAWHSPKENALRPSISRAGQ
jgi:hypothetical protein